MLRDHRQLLVTFADKAAVRDYVSAVIGADYLPAVIAIVDDPRDLAGLSLPEAYAMKPTHGSGAAIVVSANADADAALPPARWGWTYSHVRPDVVTRQQLIDTADSWLGKLYGQGPNREWAYGRVRPRIIVEEFLVGADGGIPEDLKFFVFHGVCRYIQRDASRFDGRRTQDFFRRDWEHLALSGGPAFADPMPQRPSRLDEMITLAEKLGCETDFVRVDLYHLPSRIVFGELTSYPAGGDSPFQPERFNDEFGQHWKVPRRYR